MTKTVFSDICDFHEKFGLGYNGPPRELPYHLQIFRLDFLQEELYEYKDAVKYGEKEKALDALVDLVYVAVGTAYLHGFDFQTAWDRVHSANMKKVRAASAGESKRNSTHDVVKPPGWVAPDLSDLVEG